MGAEVVDGEVLSAAEEDGNQAISHLERASLAFGNRAHFGDHNKFWFWGIGWGHAIGRQDMQIVRWAVPTARVRIKHNLPPEQVNTSDRL